MSGEIQQHWAVNILQEDVDITDEANQRLIDVGAGYVKAHPHEPDILNPERVGYNFLDDPDPVVQAFKEFLKERVYNMMEAEGYRDPRQYDIEAIGYARGFNKGERAKTHVHRGCDYVAVYYADLDEEADTGENDFLTPQGRLLITDPIAYRNRALNHLTNVTISPRKKFLVMHPSYLFHQSEPYQGDTFRRFFVFVIRVAEPIQHPFYRKI